MSYQVKVLFQKTFSMYQLESTIVLANKSPL